MTMISNAVCSLPFVLGDLTRWPARLYGGHAAIEMPDRTLTFAELDDEIERCAQELARLGARGERWGLALGPCIDFFVHLLALLRCGAVVMPLPQNASLPVLQHISDQCTLDRLVLPQSNGDGIDIIDQLHQSASTRSKRVIDIDDALIFQTSGSTGKPRSVVFRHHAILANIWANVRSLGYIDSDRTLLVLPLHHAYALVHQALAHLAVGATIVVPPRPLLPTRLWRELQASRVASIATVPPIARFLAQGLAASGANLPDLRLITIGAARVDKETVLTLRRLLPHSRIAITYGLTEAGPRVATKFVESDSFDPQCVGTPLPNVAVDISEDGVLVIRGRSVVSEPDAFCTGDLAELDGDEIRLLGRSGRAINRAGVMIAAEVIEQALERHPDVRYARVRAEAHPIWGEVPVATVTLTHLPALVTGSDLLQFCAARLRREECPVRIELSTDQFAGKEVSFLGQFSGSPT